MRATFHNGAIVHHHNLVGMADGGEPMGDHDGRADVDASIAWIGDERKGIVHSRRHFANSPVMKGLPDSKQLRIALLRADTREEVFALMDEFVLRYGETL